LTLNLGLRWDLFTPYAETRGYQANFIAAGGNGPPPPTKSPIRDARSRGRRSSIPWPLSAMSTSPASPASLLAMRKRTTSRRVSGSRTSSGLRWWCAEDSARPMERWQSRYGGTLGFNYPFVYVQTVPAPDTNHPLLLAPGQAATMETAFTVFNFQSPAVLQSPTPYTTTPVTCPAGSSCDGGQYIGSDYLAFPSMAASSTTRRRWYRRRT